MASFVQIALAVASFVISFLGAAYVVLWTIDTWSPWAFLVYGVLLAIGLYMLRRPNTSTWLRKSALGFALASPVLVGLASYGRLFPTVIVSAIALTVLVVVLRNGFGLCGKALPMAWIAAFVIPIFTFALDHALFSGRVFAFKWSQIENPVFFSPYEIGKPEHHGRKSIFVYDWNGADSRAVALVWGWSIYPKFIDLGEKRPEGPLLAIPAIQKVTQ